MSTVLKFFVYPLLTFLSGVSVLAAESVRPAANPVTGLHRYDNCRYIDADWNDGDSFLVELPAGQRVVARLYEVDCLETSIHDTTAARRLRAQRRYFGISNYGENPRESIEKAIELGEIATIYAREKLKEPFTIWTSHADARGGGNRIYVFIETAEGKSLSELLVRAGLARAFGVYRQKPNGTSQSEAIERMQDLELAAAAGRRGVWAYTDWDALPEERLAERSELEELRVAMRRAPLVTAETPVNINEADAAVLQRLPGVGPSLAQRIIESREGAPFKEPSDLMRVSGIGGRTYEALETLITVGGND